MTESDRRFSGLSDDLKPRELLERAADPSYVPDAALLAIILKTGTEGMDVYALARRLIDVFGSVKQLMGCDCRTLELRIAEWNAANPERPIRGIGHVKCLELAAAFELGRRWSRMTPEEVRSRLVDTPEAAYGIFKSVFAPGDDKEELFALLLDVQLHPLRSPIRISRGTTDSAPAFARDVFKEALKWGANAIMVAHNHPSGNLEPSTSDIDFTRRLLELGEIAQIRLFDHLILSVDHAAPKNYCSIRETNPELFT